MASAFWAVLSTAFMAFALRRVPHAGYAAVHDGRNGVIELEVTLVTLVTGKERAMITDIGLTNEATQLSGFTHQQR